MTLPEDHALRFQLNDEVHARPPEAMAAPLRVSYLVLLTDWPARPEDGDPVRALAEHFGIAAPEPGSNHFSADVGPLRIKWERHTEFSRFTLIAPDDDGAPFRRPVIGELPDDWLAGLPGKTLFAAHVAFLPDSEDWADHQAISQRLFDGNVLIGAPISGGRGTALTDFRIHQDGYSRILVLDNGMPPFQAGRMIQRLLEIETYRMMALLAFPVARQLSPALIGHEGELAEITTVMADAGEQDEPTLLDRLTGLQAAIESRHSGTHYRFSAAAAYYELVKRRIEELREDRIQGLQGFSEFTERRLAPAMNTCQAVALRQESLSFRVARVTQLLSTRVDVTRERQNQAVLESMNRRAKLQLRLQQTVEGLSAAAITYYIVGLVGYAAKSLAAGGIAVNPDVAMGISIPIVGILVALGVRRVRKEVMHREDDERP